MQAMLNEELTRLDKRFAAQSDPDVPALFEQISLENFGRLFLNLSSNYPNIKSWLPPMPPDEVQLQWTGASGDVLMDQSVGFVKRILSIYTEVSSTPIRNACVLDFGCGWGRLIRLLYKFCPVENIYGVDPWDKSIAICQQYGVRGHLAISDYVPRSLPFKKKFDLIYAFSVFTHLSENTTLVVSETLRRYVSDNGLFVFTIRPKKYWFQHLNGILADSMCAAHDDRGFAFNPHEREAVDGEITFGETSMSIEYVRTHFKGWQISDVLEPPANDPLQQLVILRPN
jgi:SAM-dependent methyltransferase